MAATEAEMRVALDLDEKPRVMEGNLLRQEVWESASLATRMTTTYDDNGAPTSTICEDI